jgi:hypothetical protein
VNQLDQFPESTAKRAIYTVAAYYLAASASLESRAGQARSAVMARLTTVAMLIILVTSARSVLAQTGGDPAPPIGSAPGFAAPSDPTAPGSQWDDGSPDGIFGRTTRKPDDPPDLTLWNFFSLGWNDAYTRRSSEDRAPDLALLRVQTNFMEREFRLNYAYSNDLNSKTRDNLTNLDYFIAWAFNRRFMIEVLGNYQWVDGRGTNPDVSGQAGRFVGRVQLISTPDSSYTFNFQVISPNVSLGVHETTFSYGSAGFEDLTRFGLDRVGLYGSVLFDSGVGPSNTIGDVFFKPFDKPPATTVRNDVQYVLTLAKTLTRPDTPLIGNFTLFAENFAQTNLDGNHAGTTQVTVTPGVRFNLGKPKWNNIGIDNWLMFGVDVPVAGPRAESAIYRFTYIKNF